MLISFIYHFCRQKWTLHTETSHILLLFFLSLPILGVILEMISVFLDSLDCSSYVVCHDKFFLEHVVLVLARSDRNEIIEHLVIALGAVLNLQKSKEKFFVLWIRIL